MSGMKNNGFLCIVSIWLLLSSCAPALQKHGNSLSDTVQSENRLYSLRIEQWEKLKFAGLVALQLRESRLSYAMLDATGIKLIEAEVDFQGSYKLKRAMAGLKGSSLPGFFSTALVRIFLMEPLENPCSRDGLMLFCTSPSENGQNNKIMKIEPFTLWEVQRNKGAIIYLQPWLGIRMVLTDLNSDP